MNCKETQRCMKLFLEGKLDEQESLEFMLHVRGCKDCMDELVIQYLLTVERLEDAGASDVQNELEERLNAALHKKQISEKLKAGLFLVMATAACLFLYV